MLMRPTLDFAFKKIFGNEKKPEILIGFLNAVLECPEDNRIRKVKIKNPNNDKDFKEESYSILDVKAETNRNEIINIEIQVDCDVSMIKRTLYYGARMMAGQPKPPKENYNILKNVITINILDHCLSELQNEPFHSSYAMTSLQTKEILTQTWMIHFIELPKMKPQQQLSEKEIWFSFLKNPSLFISDNQNLAGNQPFKSAVDELKRLSLDPEEIELYLAREKQIWDYDSKMASARQEGLAEGLAEGMEKGRAEGIEQGKLELAKNLLDILSDEEIARRVNLPIEKIAQLR